MRWTASFVLVSLLLVSAQRAVSQQPDSSATSSEVGNPYLTVPAGTKVILGLTSPIWAKSATVGDSVYAASAFPVAIDGRMAIPPGTYVQGKLDGIQRPTRRSQKAEFRIHFTKLIFSNGYTVLFSDIAPGALNTVQMPTANPPAAAQPATQADIFSSATPPSASADVLVQVNYQSDLLLDNGAQFEMILQTPLSLNAESVAQAARHATPPQLTPYKSSTRCIPTPATAGTSDTVFPGTPGTPGTPDTVIPSGIPGVPDTVIPGIPATPGTPATVIPGSSGSPGYACPGPPIVVSGPGISVSGGTPAAAPMSRTKTQTKTATTTEAFAIGGTVLPKGKYKISWQEPGPDTIVEFAARGQTVLRISAKVIVTFDKAQTDEFAEDPHPGGIAALLSFRLRGETSELQLQSKNPPGSAQAPAPNSPKQ